MFNEFSPFNLTILIALALSFPLFYFLGIFFSPRLEKPGDNVILRLSMGVLIFIFGNALFHVGMKTMLLPFAVALLLFFNYQPKDVFKDLKSFSWQSYLLVFTSFILLYLAQGTWFNLQDQGNLIVGNWDYANAGGLAHDLYLLKRESSRFLFENDTNRIFYHYGDLWFSGFYSFYLNILPYYAYTVVYGFISNLAIVFLLVRLAFKFNKNKLAILLFVLFVFLSSGLQYFWKEGLLGDQISLIIIPDILFSTYPFRILSLCYLAGTLLILEKNQFKGLLIFALSSVFHPVLAIGVPISLTIYFGLQLLLKRFSQYKSTLGLSSLHQITILASSFLPILYAFIDHRMQSSQGAIFKYSFILEAFANWGFVLLSALFFLPFIWGIFYFYKEGFSKNLFWLSVSLFLGTSFSYAIIFTILKGDSEQILTVFIVSFMVPIGSLGMFAWLNSQYKSKKIIAAIFVIACIVSRIVYFSDSRDNISYIDYCLGFDEEWASRSTVNSNEILGLKETFQANEMQNVGVYICPDKKTFYNETIIMQQLPYLRGLLSGVEFLRINVIPIDTFQGFPDKSKLQYFMNSQLGYYYNQGLSEEQVAESMVTELDMNYLLLDQSIQNLCLPEFLEKNRVNSIDFGRYQLIPVQSND